MRNNEIFVSLSFVNLCGTKKVVQSIIGLNKRDVFKLIRLLIHSRFSNKSALTP